MLGKKDTDHPARDSRGMKVVRGPLGNWSQQNDAL